MRLVRIVCYLILCNTFVRSICNFYVYCMASLTHVYIGREGLGWDVDMFDFAFLV